MKIQKETDWVQLLTILGAIVGCMAYIRSENIEQHREHREDMLKMDEKLERSLQKMDEKWERLFGLFVEKFRT